MFNSIRLFFSAAQEDLDKKRNLMLRILTLLIVPACGFFSVAIAYIGFYRVESIWPWIMLPPSVAIIALLLYEGLTDSPWHEKIPEISAALFNRISQSLIFIFGFAFVWWIFFLVEFIELHK